VKRIAIYVLVLSAGFGGIYAMCKAVRVAGNRIACHTEEKLRIEDKPAGLTFEVEDTTCHVLAADESVSVYARRAIPERSSIFSRWDNQRTLLFRYDPGKWDNPLPSITRPSQSTVLISVPEVSSIDRQDRQWNSLSIMYDIGRVDYPAPN
jgi:hypothetical protein